MRRVIVNEVVYVDYISFGKGCIPAVFGLLISYYDKKITILYIIRKLPMQMSILNPD